MVIGPLGSQMPHQPPQAAEKFECPRLTKVARALAALRGEQTVTATILPRMSKARSRAGTSGPARVPAGLTPKQPALHGVAEEPAAPSHANHKSLPSRLRYRACAWNRISLALIPSAMTAPQLSQTSSALITG